MALFLGLQTATFLLYPHMVEGGRREAEDGERGKEGRPTQRERERENASLLSSYKDANTIMGPSLVTSSRPIYFSKIAPTTPTITLSGVRASTDAFWKNTNVSP